MANDYTADDRKSRARTNGWHVLVLIAVVVLFEAWISRIAPRQRLGRIAPALSSDSPSILSRSIDFSVQHARQHLQSLTALGPRSTGAAVTEFAATKLIRSKLLILRQLLPPELELDIDVQHPSSSFHLDFLGGITNIYNNVTNVIARLQPKHESAVSAETADAAGVLVVAHFDSIPNSPGAADDGIGIACMIEALRMLIMNTATTLKRPVILLFNGAEEWNHQAAHGFITQHPWAQQVRYLLNLEAIGSGGQELMFQCNSGWLAEYYGQITPHPHASVVAHELFKHVLHRMASTDWATMIAHGPHRIRGMDTAYIDNGYVYHTSFDSANIVTDETLRNTGENIFFFAKGLATAPVTAEEVSGFEKKEEAAVFFDVLGIKLITYRGGYVTILHTAALLMGLSVAAAELTAIPSLSIGKLGMLLRSEAYHFSVAVGVGVLSGVVAMVICPMRWYSGGILWAVIIFIPPILAAMCYTRSNSHPQYGGGASVAVGLIFPWAVLLLPAIYFGVMSAFVCALWLFFGSVAALMYHIALRLKLHQKYEQRVPPQRYICSPAFFYQLMILPMLIMWAEVVRLTLMMLLPLLGKSGTILPTDPVVGALIAMLVASPASIIFAYDPLPSLVGRRRHWIVGCFVLFCITAAVVSSYSTHRPKRLWIQHVERWYDPSNDGMVTTQARNSTHHSMSHDCGLWISGFDEQGLQPLLNKQKGQNILDAKYRIPAHCSVGDGECYMRFPWYFPVADALRDSVYAPMECPHDIPASERVELRLLSVALEERNEQQRMRRVIIHLQGPAHMHLIIRDGAHGQRLMRWHLSYKEEMSVSAAGFSKPPIARSEGIHYLEVGFGWCSNAFRINNATGVIHKCEHSIALDVVGDEPIQIAAYGHYTDLPHNNLVLQEVQKELPVWARGAEWTNFPSALIQRSI